MYEAESRKVTRDESGANGLAEAGEIPYNL